MTPEERKRIFDMAVMAEAIVRDIQERRRMVNLVVCEACDVPADKLPEDIKRASTQFLDWMYGLEGPPKWMK